MSTPDAEGSRVTSPRAGALYGAAWLRAWLDRASRRSFDDAQASEVSALAERTLVDLFDVAEETALANGRARILRHDLPLTKGLRSSLDPMEALACDLELEPLLVFLADAGVPGPLDELVRAEIPRLMAALLVLAGRVIAVLKPENASPVERLELLLRPAPGPPDPLGARAGDPRPGPDPMSRPACARPGGVTQDGGWDFTRRNQGPGARIGALGQAGCAALGFVFTHIVAGAGAKGPHAHADALARTLASVLLTTPCGTQREQTGGSTWPPQP